MPQIKYVKLLVLTSRFPYPLEKGDKLRIFHQIRELSRYHEIVLCSLAEQEVQDIDYQEVKQYCSKIFILYLNKKTVVFNILNNLLKHPFNRIGARNLPFQVAYFFNKNIKKQITQITDGEKPDHIYCQLARMAEYVRHLNLPKTLDYMDAFSMGAARRAESSYWLTKPFWKIEARKMAEYEAQLANNFDNLTIISTQDREVLDFTEKNKIQVVQNGVDTDYFKKNDTAQHTPQYHIAFVGNLGYYPNVEAAKYLVHQILPLLLTQMPDIKILIAGARPTTEMQNLSNKNVTVKGWLKDIRTAYSDAQIFVAPLFHGSGQQNKILEAMAMGLPCVTTSLVNNAILAKPNEEILIVDIPYDVTTNRVQQEAIFAEKIINLLQNIDHQEFISKNARLFVEKKYSWEHSATMLNNIIEKKAKQHQPN